VCERDLKERCEMGGFTRLLHSGQADDLMEEVPTFVADPLPESVVAHDWYPVLNRPWAFMQWVQKVGGAARRGRMGAAEGGRGMRDGARRGSGGAWARRGCGTGKVLTN
jgi:hypothetical protein